MRITKRTLIPLKQSKKLAGQRPDRAWAVFLPSDQAKGCMRRYFRHKAEAEAFCATRRGELAVLGVDANSLSDEVKREVLQCLKVLEPLSKSLTEAVSWFVKHHKTFEHSMTVEMATDALLARAREDGLSSKHLGAITSVMNLFGRVYSKRQVAEILTDDVQRWLDGYRTKQGEPLNPVSFNTYRRYLALFFGFCLRRRWITSNPVDLVNTKKSATKTPRLLSPGDLRRILDSCPPALKTAIALQAFCGLRVAEMSRLKWSDVLLTTDGGYIQVGSDNAKTARRRLTPIPEPLVRWLTPLKQEKGYVYEQGKGSVDAIHRAEAQLRGLIPHVKWGRNALRASALSYRLALTKDAPATALEMGNSATVLLRDYRELATKETAEKWFSVILNS